MVTAEYGQMLFKGLNTNRTYAVDFYVADVLGTAVKFDSGSGAGTGSLPYWKAPENVVLSDMSIATGNTVTTALVLNSDGATIPFARLRTANFLNTIATRPVLSFGIKAGSNFGAVEA